MKYKSLNKISTEAVENATGKGWDEWVKIIDKEGGAKLTHKEIANMLWAKKYITKGWWGQMVTVGYEYAKERRVVGKTEGVGYEIGVQKTLSANPKKVWNLMISPKGLKIWLGETKPFKLEKGSKYKTQEGVEGEIRSLSLGKKLRMTWDKPSRNAKPSTLQFYVLPAGQYLNRKSNTNDTKSTSVRFHQENLKDGEEREKMRKYWSKVLVLLSKTKLD